MQTQSSFFFFEMKPKRLSELQPLAQTQYAEREGTAN